MANCKYCTNYHLNSHERIDNCCLGVGDCRKEEFSCNENLKPKTEKKCDTTKDDALKKYHIVHK